jgi:hypothetical protein
MTASERQRLLKHRGLATWGERLVSLAEFRAAAREAGVELSESARRQQVAQFLASPDDGVAVEGPFARIAVCGGIYSNRRALAAFLEQASRRGAEAVYCLGDLGGFGPNPDKVWPLLESSAVRTIQGNYEESLATGREDCNCGYTDPRDNHYATISYRYTAERTAPEFKQWMGTLPRRRRVLVGGRELLLVHGSPRRINEFLFASTTPEPYLETLLAIERADGLLCTHTGLPWRRELPSGRVAANVGVIGRPANDGRANVWYASIEARGDSLGVELVPLAYDHFGLAAEMRREQLPEPFVETILTGWWTTCLEILPARERSASRY